MKYTRFRSLCVLLLSAMLALTVSCRRLPGEGTGETETDPPESTAPAAESDAPRERGVEDILALFHEKTAVMFAEESDGTHADALLEEILPYLLGESGFSTEESYQITNIVTTGEGIAMPREVVCRGGILTVTGEDPDRGAYREIDYIHPNGTVYISTYDGFTAVDSYQLALDTSPLGELDAEALALTADQLSESDKKNVWTVSDIYARRVLKSLWGEAAVAELKNDHMLCELNARALESDGTLTMTLTVSELTDFRFALTFSAVDESTEEMMLTMEAGEESLFRLVCRLEAGELTAMEMRTLSGESETTLTQSIRGAHTELSMKVTAGEVTVMSCEFTMEMQDGEAGQGSIELIFREPKPKAEDGVILLSESDEGYITSMTRGEFTVRLREGGIGMLEMEMTTATGTLTSTLSMRLSHPDAPAAGDIVMYYALDTADSANAAAHTRMEMEVKTARYTAERTSYTLEMSLTDTAGTSTAAAEVVTPAQITPDYTERERALMSRAQDFLKFYKGYIKEAEEGAETVAKAISNGLVSSLPPTFCFADADQNGIAVRVHLVEENGGCYVYTDLLLDPENWTYYYSTYDARLGLSAKSGLEEDCEYLRMHARSAPGYQTTEIGNAIAYYYEPTEEIYVVADMENSRRYGYSLTEPTAADFPGRVLHRVVFDENGAVAGEVHRYTAVYDGACTQTLTCSECGNVIVSEHPVHEIIPEIEICAQEGRQPHTMLGRCLRCPDAEQLVLTDSRGNQIRIMLVPATNEALRTAMGYGNKTFPTHIKMSRLPSEHRVITGMQLVGDGFDCDVVIPDLRGITGDTILGIGYSEEPESYRIPDGLLLTLVFPEGMEFIVGDVLSYSVFDSVGELHLPSTLLYMEALFGQCPIEEIDIPASVTYLGDTLHFPKVKRLTVRASLDTLPVIRMSNLEELNLLGRYRVLGGFAGSVRVEEFTVPEGVEEIGAGIFAYARSLRHVTLPEGLLRIHDRAFQGCSGLESITIPDSVIYIGVGAFKDCTMLSELVLPSGLQRINGGTFSGMTSLTRITLPAQVNFIDNAAFRDCVNLEEVTVLGKLNYVGYDAFVNCPKLAVVPRVVWGS